VNVRSMGCSGSAGRPGSRRLRPGRYGWPGSTIMVTKCKHPKRGLDLTLPAVAEKIANSLLVAREKRRCYLLAWCLMPNHIHILLSPRDPGDDRTDTASAVSCSVEAGSVGARSSGRHPTNLSPLSRFVADWANSATHRVNRLIDERGPLWQEGFYDHAIRRTESIGEVVNYIHNNPVRRQLAASAEAWQWSSANPLYATATDWDWFVGNRPEDGAPTIRSSGRLPQRKATDAMRGGSTKQ